MDTAEPLFQPVGVPGQVVIDHQMRAALKVDALPGSIVGDHDANHRIGVESGDGGTAGLAGNAAMNHHNRCRIAEARSDLLSEIFQRVLWLGEDQEFPPQAGGGIEHDRLIEDDSSSRHFASCPDSLRRSARCFEIASG